MFCTPEKQIKMLRLILDFYKLGFENIKKGANITSSRTSSAFRHHEDEVLGFERRNRKLDEIRDKLQKSMKQIAEMFK